MDPGLVVTGRVAAGIGLRTPAGIVDIVAVHIHRAQQQHFPSVRIAGDHRRLGLLSLALLQIQLAGALVVVEVRGQLGSDPVEV